MHKHALIIVLLSIAWIPAACKAQNTAQVPEADIAESRTPQTQPPATEIAGATTGTIIETMNAGGYTYVLLGTGSKQLWAAGPETSVNVGDKVSVPEGMVMTNFASKTLERTFDTIHFVTAITHVDQAGKAQVAAAHGVLGSKTETPTVDVSGIEKASGGYTIGELFENKTSLAGKDVTVRGKVVKFTSAVMGKNWLHLQDGTGTAGGNDLTITTAASATVGATVLVHGKLATDRDFGYGYKYDVLIEDGQVTVE